MTGAGLTSPGTGLISFEKATKTYSNLTVVDQVSVSIGEGEFFSLLGPSGSGKTTTLMMLAGFVDVTSGRILVGQRDVSRLRPQQRGFGMVFQNYAIFPHLNVFENVAFPLRARKVDKVTVAEKVGSALKAVHLDRLHDRYAHQLSGGQQQRVAIARAISFEPSIVLMDEPLGALDKNLRYAMQVEIKELQKRLGLTVVYVTHDQEEAMNMSDRIGIMNNGRLEQVGPPQEVYDNPVSRFTGKFLGEANALDGTVTEVAGNAATLRVRGGDLRAGMAGAAVKPGDSATFFIRPEKLRISAGTPVAGSEFVAGRVEKQSFLGNITRYAVAIRDGEQVMVDAANSSNERHAVHSEVFLNWNAADARILVS